MVNFQNFWDPETDSGFLYSDTKSAWNASWWGGEPVSINSTSVIWRPAHSLLFAPAIHYSHYASL